MATSRKRFLIVDDDPQNNILSKMALKRSLGDVEVITFHVPEPALEYIHSEFKDNDKDEKTTIFLDINMPTMTAWEFLKEFDTFKEALKKQFDIYILSSSVDPTDIQQAKTNSLVVDFIEKPLNKKTLVRLFGLDLEQQ